ncbi:procathepsin L-like [Convolutriloba macropyga]|uniref:procathepsin L-like n=1 Tax=Convolutriloba macropyga TaxID=536237 RepID=UPI003F528A27
MIWFKIALSVIIFVEIIWTWNVRQTRYSSKPYTKLEVPLNDITSKHLQEWSHWKNLYKKEYKNAEEESTKFSNWLRNLNSVSEHNLNASLNKISFTAALNEFSDMSIQEIRNNMLGQKMNFVQAPPAQSQEMSASDIDSTLPDEIDWREKGFVTEVKNQGPTCRAGWAFSATGSMEGGLFRRTKRLTSLSEQNLIDCSYTNCKKGCDGGDPGSGITFSEESSVAYVDGVWKQYRDEVGLKSMVGRLGPASTMIDASHESFQNYAGGVYDEPNCSSKDLDHGVLIVGYGKENGKDYWLVKNSWGTSWGEKGYIKMSRNKNNQCGIASRVFYPYVYPDNNKLDDM